MNRRRIGSTRHELTPTGLVLCVILASTAIVLPGPFIILLPQSLFVICFLLVERRSTALKAIGSGLLVVAPIAMYLTVVWVLVLGGETVTSEWSPGGSGAAYVVHLCSRLLLFVVLLHAGFRSPFSEGALRFLAEITLPRSLKVIVAMTLSIASTIRVSAERAWLSLVAANLLAPRLAWRNVRHCSLLLLTIWMSTIGTISARLQTKWVVEDVRSELTDFFSSHREIPLGARDVLWLAASAGIVGLSVFEALRG